jgi:hypothetical protein
VEKNSSFIDSGTIGFMRAIELHLIETDADARVAVLAGLATEDDVSTPSCISCTEEVGHIDGTFYEYLIGLDENDQWIVCVECAQDAITPAEPLVPLDDLDPLSFDEEDEE